MVTGSRVPKSRGRLRPNIFMGPANGDAPVDVDVAAANLQIKWNSHSGEEASTQILLHQQQQPQHLWMVAEDR